MAASGGGPGFLHPRGGDGVCPAVTTGDRAARDRRPFHRCQSAVPCSVHLVRQGRARTWSWAHMPALRRRMS